MRKVIWWYDCHTDEFTFDDGQIVPGALLTELAEVRVRDLKVCSHNPGRGTATEVCDFHQVNHYGSQ